MNSSCLQEKQYVKKGIPIRFKCLEPDGIVTNVKTIKKEYIAVLVFEAFA